MTEIDYNECVRINADKVYRFIVKNLRNEEDARDIVQTSFERLWRNRKEVSAEKSKSYLFTIAYHQMIDHIRKAKRVQLNEDLAAEKSGYTQPSDDIRKILDEAMTRLNETQRALVMLKDYEGYSYEEIGQITGLNQSQVKVYLHRARLHLKQWLVSMENII
ncbi:MAG: RNA polymerase sigma factor [Bacteroidetes bacterium]|nr:MAG: RNA polymerase sigma factor [Bacteroidota bacterium]